MANFWEKLGRRRSRLLIAGMVVLAVLVAATAAFFVWRKVHRRQAGGTTSPILVASTGSSGRAVMEVSSDPAMPTSEGSSTAPFVSLSEGGAAPQAAESLPVAAGVPLSEQDIASILARLPAIGGAPSDQVDLLLPEKSLPPPRPGQTIQESFPPPAAPSAPAEVPTGPLEVLRYSPEGEISLAPFVNVTFNQPMVALATLEALAAGDVPVRLEPALPGTWKWLGTKTLRFEYDSSQVDRLPMATEYVVTIPSGTRSATGGVLAQEVRWTFSTPPPRMLTSYPYGTPQPLEPLFLVTFDQRVDPAAVLESIQVTENGSDVPLQLATTDQVAADKEAARLSKDAGEGRWLAFVAKEPLPTDAAIVVTIGPGTPSAEGPLVTGAVQRYEFRTYAPLRIVGHGCGWYGEECPPLAPLFIEFNNPLDLDAYQESMLRIEPALPGATVDVSGNTITIHGNTAGRTTYTVTVDAAIQDTFGQALGKAAALTFKVGSAEPSLIGPQGDFVTLDPASKSPALTVYTINYKSLKVRAYEVKPSDWIEYRTYIQEYYYQEKPPEPPGRLAMEKTIPLEGTPDVLLETNIDLSSALEGGLGHLVVIVEPQPLPSRKGGYYYPMVRAWVQVTQVALDAFSDYGRAVAWATALKDGSPLEGVSVETGDGKQLAVTTADGIARFELPAQETPILVARKGADAAILSPSTWVWGGDPWKAWPVQDELRWYVFDDRAMYRPGEVVHVKGWLRQVGARRDGDVELVGTGLQSVGYQVMDSQGNTLLSGEAKASALGGFDFSFTLPANVNLGYGSINLDARGRLGSLASQGFGHSFQVQEFRTPEFEVTARNETPGPFFAGGDATVAVEAAYYAGGGLPNAEVSWAVTTSPGTYSPPNWPGFIFGTWRPWWRFYDSYERFPWEAESQVETFSGTTDASGTHYLKLSFAQPAEPKPMSVRAEATVMDVNRQAWTGSTSLLVHPADLYVGLRCDTTFVQRGTPLVIDTIVTDLDGVPVADRPVRVQAARLEWKTIRGEWKQEAVDLQECTVGSTDKPVACTFKTDAGGEYQITATVTDSRGRINQSRFTRWVSGGGLPPARSVEKEAASLIPDKETYQPGDVAHILVQSPFSPAEGLLTVSRSGILYTERFRIDEGTATLDIPIEEAHIPNLHVQVDLVGSAPRTDDQGNPVEGAPPRPAYASGELNLSVPALRRTLSLQAAPRDKELEPGGKTTLDLLLTDAAGNPVPDAEMAVVVVDEAILALTSYQLSDPIALFYAERSSGVTSRYARESIILANVETLDAAGSRESLQVAATMVVEEAAMDAAMPSAAPAPASAKGMDEAESQQQPIALRTDFNPLATFAAEVRTEADGTAQVEIDLPDNLTRYRVMVVAVSGGTHFGTAEANLVARLPLMVRPSAPRFLSFGDLFEFPVVLQNQTDEPMTVDVALRVTNLELTGSQGLHLTVPARDRLEVRFPATTLKAGTARFQVAAVSGTFADAASGELPVYTPATTEAFATYGVVDEGAVAQPVAAVGDGVFPQFGGLEITTSSTALQALTDAVLYLVSYPYECSEQLASRILAVSALRDVLEAFSAEGLPSAVEMQAAVERDIARLQKMQNEDGGFPYWARGRDSIPFNTIHAAHALYRAAEMDFAVPSDMRSRALDYLRQIESHYPDWYDKETRHSLSAYALYVRHLMGDGDVDKAQALLDEAGLGKLSLGSVAWLWQVLKDDPASATTVEAMRRHISNRAVETAGAANFTTSYSDQTYLLLDSDRRTEAIVLDALIAGDPKSDLIPKVVNGLLAHRVQGRWNSTQENVFVLLALDSYFNTFESQTPDFVARIWLGDAYVGEHAYRGRTTERRESDVPMSYLAGLDGAQDLILSKEGPGRLYYRLGLRYAPTDLSLDALDMGFVVQRTYEAVDDPADVTKDEAGVWHIKAGARVRVKLTMVADNRRYHVALVDPLPAGLEIVNPALAVSGSIPQDSSSSDYKYGWWWWGPWYEHQNMRDERAEAFTPLLWEGVYNYSYVARATTPGTFVVPPAKAEEMYSPEVFGRSSSDKVIVE